MFSGAKYCKNEKKCERLICLHGVMKRVNRSDCLYQRFRNTHCLIFVPSINARLEAASVSLEYNRYTSHEVLPDI